MLMRFDPFRDLDRIVQERVPGVRLPAVPMDAYRNGDQLVVCFDLPGVDPDSIELTVDQNGLTVSADRHGRSPDGVEVLAAERPQGRFTRQLFLGEGLDRERVDARYDHGVLTVTIPVAEQAKPRKVEVSTGAPTAGAIASSTE